ncbi:MAG: c-type cytochrome [Ferruginibacter sp.]|nr:c-type cytochrome [Rhodoferax sp.]
MRQALFTLALAGACCTPALASLDLAKAKNCLGCHTVDKKVVGPAFKDVADKYRSNPAAAAQLALKIRLGGSGVWGPMAMPANAQVNEADAQKLAAWVLVLK